MPLPIDSNQVFSLATQGLTALKTHASESSVSIQDFKKEVLDKVAQFAKTYPLWENYAEIGHNFIADGSNIFLSLISGIALRKGLYNPESKTGKCRKCCLLSSQTFAAFLLGAIPLATSQNSKEAIPNITAFALGFAAGGVYYNTLEKNQSLIRENDTLQAQVTQNAADLKKNVMSHMEGLFETYIERKANKDEKEAKVTDSHSSVSVRERKEAIEAKKTSSTSSTPPVKRTPKTTSKTT